MGCGCTYTPKPKTQINSNKMEQPIINKFASPNYSIKFAVDNNPTAITEKLAAWGYIVATPEQAIAAIKKLATQGNTIAIKDVFSVPYLNNAANYTGGLREFFVKNSQAPQGTATARTFWDGVLSFLGGGLTSLLASGQGGATLTAEQLAAMEAEAKKKEEEAAKKRKTMYWIIGVIVFIILLVIVLAIFANKKKTEK